MKLLVAAAGLVVLGPMSFAQERYSLPGHLVAFTRDGKTLITAVDDTIKL
jgi:hypothetical protein